MNKHLIVSLHDIHPQSADIVAEQIQFCENLGVGKFSILAIPQYHHGKKLGESAETLKWLDERHQKGDDIVLHGFYHDRQDREGGNFFFTKIYTANEAEFLDLSDEEVRRRLEEGRSLWRKQGWNLNGFIAPAWLFPSAQEKILQEFGLTYTTRLKTIHALQQKKVIAAQSLCYSSRAWWRREVSLLWNPMLFQRAKNASVMRVSLHPGDFCYPRLRQQIGRLLELALADGFQPISYSDYVAL